MKKSNKLLLAGFLAVVLLISAIHISLYAKYKAGDFTIFNEAEDLTAANMQSFPNILFVSVRNVPHARVKFDNVARVEKGAQDDFRFSRKGDTLLISLSEEAHAEDVSYPAVLHVPFNATISAFHSHLSFVANDKNVTESSPVIHLVKSTARFSAGEKDFRLGHVSITASDSSAAAFYGKMQVSQLDIRLSNSSIEYGDGDFGRMSIETDSLSRVSLQTKHLLKAAIRTTQ